MKYLKLFENFTGSELEEDLKWIMVNFLDDKFQFKLKQNVHDKLFIYEVDGYDKDRIGVLKDLLEDLDGRLQFKIIGKEICIGFGEYINLYKTIKEYGIRNFTINDDLSIDVDGDVFISLSFNGHNLTNISLKFNKVSGDFSCSNNKLTSLIGCPIKVSGNFWCTGNELTSLEGAPKSVGGDFSCSNNHLTTLFGCPKEVGRDFSCYDNFLTSLDNCPKKIGGDFNIRLNDLETLNSFPIEIGGYVYIDRKMNNNMPKEFKYDSNLRGFKKIK